MTTPRPRSVPVQLDDEVELTIETLADGPDALAKIDGYVVLVAGALPGERVSARITSAARKFGRAVVTDVIDASPDRVEPECRHFLECGGCHLQHAAYATQLDLKRARVEKALARALGDAAPPVAATLAPTSPWGQRHKVALHLEGRGRFLTGGLHPLRSRGIVAIGDCPAADPAAFELGMTAVALLAETGLPAWDEQTRPDGVLRSVVVRRAAASDQSQVILVTQPGARLPEKLLDQLLGEGATSVALNSNDGPPSKLLGPHSSVVRGPRRIRESIAGVDYMMSPGTFFQTAPGGAAHAVGEVLGWLEPTAEDTVVDLYCGGGLFALPLAQRAYRVAGIEVSSDSLDDARASAEQLGIENLRLERGSVDGVLRGWARRRDPAAKPDLLVLDPPRTGCGAETAKAIASLGARRIAYVSCDTEALGRDLAAFAAAGLRLESVVPIDMFPQTFHVEAVARIARR